MQLALNDLNELNDEIKHFFLKESGIIFPAIKKNVKNKTTKEAGNFLQAPALETIHQRQQVLEVLMASDSQRIELKN